MMRAIEKLSWTVLFVPLLVSTGCGDAFSPMGDPASQPDDTKGAMVQPPAETPESDDITVWFYDRETGPSGEQNPSFEVYSNDFTQSESDTWSFRNATATIYSKDGENIVIEAGEAWMNQTTENAVMSGKVLLTKGLMTMTLEDLEWNNEARTATSSKPLVFENGDTHMEAQSVVYYPDENRVELSQASGRFSNPRRTEE